MARTIFGGEALTACSAVWAQWTKATIPAVPRRVLRRVTLDAVDIAGGVLGVVGQVVLAVLLVRRAVEGNKCLSGQQLQTRWLLQMASRTKPFSPPQLQAQAH